MQNAAPTVFVGVHPYQFTMLRIRGGDSILCLFYSYITLNSIIHGLKLLSQFQCGMCLGGCLGQYLSARRKGWEGLGGRDGIRYQVLLRGVVDLKSRGCRKLKMGNTGVLRMCIRAFARFLAFCVLRRCVLNFGGVGWNGPDCVQNSTHEHTQKHPSVGVTKGRRSSAAAVVPRLPQRIKKDCVVLNYIVVAAGSRQHNRKGMGVHRSLCPSSYYLL